MRTIKCLLACCIALTAIHSHAQTLDVLNKNNLKLNVSSLALKNISLQYERSVARHVSVALGVRFEPKGLIPLHSIASNVFDENDFNLDDLKMGNTAITPEVRFYLGRGRNRGFYIAPYARYANFNLSLPVNYKVDGQNNEALFDGHVNSFSGGLLVGMQYTFAKVIVLDIWLLGGHYGSSTGNAVFTSSQQLSQQEQHSLSDELNGLSLKPFTFTSTVTANGATMNTTGPGWACVDWVLILG